MYRTILIILIILVAILIIGGGFFIISNRKPIVNKQQNNTQKTAVIDQSIFSSQTATINGKVNKINDNALTITNKEGKTTELMISSSLNINKLDSSQKMFSSNKKEDIELDKEAIIFLNYENDKYVVTTITYTLPQKSKDIPLPPTSTNAAVIRTTPKPVSNP